MSTEREAAAPRPKAARSTARRPKPAVGAKILAAGVSVAAGIGLVGAFAATRPGPTTEVRRVLVIDLGTTENGAQSVQVVELPAPAAADARPGPVTESGGS